LNKNKTINNIGISLLSLLILTYSTVLQFSIPSVVLCFGDDGHIAFEQSDANHQCIDDVDNFTRLGNKYTDLSNQDDDCRDIPLVNISSALYLEKNGKIKIFKPALVDSKIKAIKACLVPHPEIKNEFMIIQSSMKSLQSTILLI